MNIMSQISSPKYLQDTIVDSASAENVDQVVAPKFNFRIGAR